MSYNRLNTMRDNTEAIRLAFRLGVEHRGPDIQECGILRKYAGYGGLKCILNPADSIADAAQWSKSDLGPGSYTHLTLPTTSSVLGSAGGACFTTNTLQSLDRSH